MNVTKLSKNGNTLLDLTVIDAIESDVLEGKTFVKNDGSIVTGTGSIESKPEESVTVTPDFSQGNVQNVYPPTTGYTLSSVDILKPETLVPDNVARGVTIAGITGTADGFLLPTYNGTCVYHGLTISEGAVFDELLLSLPTLNEVIVTVETVETEDT